MNLLFILKKQIYNLILHKATNLGLFFSTFIDQ